MDFKTFDLGKVIKVKRGHASYVGNIGHVLASDGDEFGIQFPNYDGLRWFPKDELEFITSDSSELKCLTETLDKRNARIAELEAENKQLKRRHLDDEASIVVSKIKSNKIPATNLIVNGPFGNMGDAELLTSLSNGYMKKLAEKDKLITSLLADLKKARADFKVDNKVIITNKDSYGYNQEATIIAIDSNSITVRLIGSGVLVLLNKKDLKKV